MKIALGQINPTVGDFSGNASKIIDFSRRAQQAGAGLILFPGGLATIMMMPFVGQMLAAGYKSIGDPLLAVADPVLFPFWIADADWARANRDVLKRWVASLQEALASIKADETKARKILATYSGLPDAIVARIPLPHYEFHITPGDLDVWRNVMVSQGLPLKNLDINRVVVTAQ